MDDRRAAWMLEQVGLAPQIHSYRRSGCSGGQEQRVAVARALGAQPTAGAG
jgi:ABC-type polar amino acid transport system ATPase subunit